MERLGQTSCESAAKSRKPSGTSGNKLQHAVLGVAFTGWIDLPTPRAASSLGEERRVSPKGSSKPSCLGGFRLHPGEPWEKTGMGGWFSQHPAAPSQPALPSRARETLQCVTVPWKVGTLMEEREGATRSHLNPSPLNWWERVLLGDGSPGTSAALHGLPVF